MKFSAVVLSLSVALAAPVVGAAPVATAASSGAEATVPFTASFESRALVELRAALDSGRASPDLRAAKASLLRSADGLLRVKPLTVMDKTGVAASGDKHDFFAIGKLAWANPATPDGMPWIRRDGAANPAVAGHSYDKARYNQTLERIRTLSLAWFYTRDERYAAKAAELVRAWFLDPATRMNPNFNYASALPGVHDGMPIGIIEGVVLIALIDHVKLLAHSKAWTPADDTALRRWFTEYMTWLTDSRFGKTEGAAANNHGVWYCAQLAASALYVGESQRVLPLVESARQKMAAQQNEAGGFISELAREQSLMYSIYVLYAYVTLARCGEQTGDDLWHFRTANGRSLERGIAFIAPYLAGEKAWTWRDIDAARPISSRAFPVACLAARQYPELAPILSRAALRAIDENRKQTGGTIMLLMDRLPDTP